MKIIVVLAMLFVLQACVTKATSGVLKMGPDTYTISAHFSKIMGGRLGSRKFVFDEGNKFCAGIKKEIMISGEDLVRGTTRLTFLCLAQNDPRLKNPNVRTEADSVVENRRR